MQTLWTAATTGLLQPSISLIRVSRFASAVALGEPN